MKKIFILLFIIVFSGFFLNLSAQGKNFFYNPVLSGFYPDPSVCKSGENYYLVNSTFAYFPGIPIFQSKDLVNWKLIGHAMNNPENFDLTGLNVSEGIFAPAIRYNNGIFYITCTFIGGGGNFIIYSKSAKGPWCNPVWIPQINGIDPSLFFDQNGKSYIIYNSIAPDNKPLYDGHRTIRMYEFNIKELKVKGEEHILVNGGADITKKPVWIEGPHIFQKDEFYYLIAAEGGTAENHSEVVFRSKNIFGPYIPYEKNPILTQRHLDPQRKNAITCTGHADIVQVGNGNWWSVFLGCRPYKPVEKNYYNLGRETFLAPVGWIDGWPVINPAFEEVQYRYSYPVRISKKDNQSFYNGNFKIKVVFEKANLNEDWVFLRTPKLKWYDLKLKKNFLSINLRPETCSEKVNPSFIGRRQQHLTSLVSVSMTFSPESENEKAGILIFQNEKHFYFLCKSCEGEKSVLQLLKSTDSAQVLELLASVDLDKDRDSKELLLKIESKEDTYSFSYAFEQNKWILLKDNIEAKFLSTKIAGGFVGCVYAMYATSMGKQSKNSAHYSWFEYEGKDKIYIE